MKLDEYVVDVMRVMVAVLKHLQLNALMVWGER